MTNKKTGIPPSKNITRQRLEVIHVDTFRPSLQTLSSVDCGVDLSGYAFEGLKKWK